MKANRKNKRKLKKGSGCKMCKPHKGMYEHQFSAKDRSQMDHNIRQIKMVEQQRKIEEEAIIFIDEMLNDDEFSIELEDIKEKGC